MWTMTQKKFEEAGNDGAQGGGGSDAGNNTGQSGSTGSDDWRAALPEELRNDPTIAQTKDVVSLAKQLVDAQKMIGSSVRMPGPDASKEDVQEFISKVQQRIPNLAVLPGDEATDEDWDSFYKAAGRPEDPNGYEFPEIKDQDGNVVDDPVWKENFKKIAHEAGLSPKQAQKIYEFRAQELMQRQQVMAQTRQQTLKALQEEFGPDWEQVVARGQKAVEALADPELRQLIGETPVGNHPGMVKLFAKIGEMIGEPGVFGEGTPAKATALTPEEAAARIMEIRRNKEHPYNNPSDPGHQQAVEYMNMLYRIKTGEA